MRIATYNINSVRLRIERVKNLLISENLDVLCLQETKVEDQAFPLKQLNKIGYNHVVFSGEKSYNGVAIISRLPIVKSQILEFVNNHKRHISAVFENDIELHNFYIPAGGDEPDIAINPKFKHKLDYIAAMEQWFSANKTCDDKIIAVGDFNIAPREHDVWSHKQLLKVVSHTPVEVEKLSQFQASIGWIDVAREFTPDSEKLYSWWSYRNRDWRKSNRGRRLDHIWVTPSLKNEYVSCAIPDIHRDGEKPSDHVPVIVELK